MQKCGLPNSVLPEIVKDYTLGFVQSGSTITTIFMPKVGFFIIQVSEVLATVYLTWIQ